MLNFVKYFSEPILKITGHFLYICHIILWIAVFSTDWWINLFCVILCMYVCTVYSAYMNICRCVYIYACMCIWKSGTTTVVTLQVPSIFGLALYHQARVAGHRDAGILPILLWSPPGWWACTTTLDFSHGFWKSNPTEIPVPNLSIIPCVYGGFNLLIFKEHYFSAYMINYNFSYRIALFNTWNFSD